MGVIGTTAVAETNEDPNTDPFPKLDAERYAAWRAWHSDADFYDADSD